MKKRNIFVLKRSLVNINKTNKMSGIFNILIYNTKPS